jgi:hypothetical protein
MAKVKRITGRGTGIREDEVEELNWAGDQYREAQSERLKKIKKNITLHLGRGTKTTTLKELPEPKPRPSTEGMTRITSRGTDSRKSTNKGSPKKN